MKYISIFSGIEAASVAWRNLGWTPLAFSEIDPFPCAILKHYYPDVPNLGDIRNVDWSPYRGKVDLIVGGSPCQSFSIAGERNGMAGASGLVTQFFRILREVTPKWFVFENVPGMLSSSKGEDFRLILKGWEECGYHVAWTTLNAEFFGVPQRRRRVFTVGHLRDWRCPVKVLFDPESLCGDSKKGCEKRKATSRGTHASSSVSQSVAKCLTSRNERYDFETENFIVQDPSRL